MSFGGARQDGALPDALTDERRDNRRNHSDDGKNAGHDQARNDAVEALRQPDIAGDAKEDESEQ